MIYIDQIKVEGMGSIVEPIKYKFNRPGLNTILGKNGVGKSTLLNALSFVLYGKLLKNDATIQPWPHLLDENYKGTKVRLRFHDENGPYEIIRFQEYTGKYNGKKGGNRLVIIQMDEEIFKERDKKQQNAWIAKKIGYSFNLFKNTIMFGQGLKRLMDEDGPNRKAVFDEAFESMYIDRARSIVEKRLPAHIKELEQLLHNKELLENDIKSLIKHYQDVRHTKLGFKRQQQEKLSRIREEIQEHKKSWSKFSKRSKRISKAIKIFERKEEELRSQIDKKVIDREFQLNMLINGTKQVTETNRDELKRLHRESENIPKECDKCGQKIPKDKVEFYKKSIKNKVNKLIILNDKKTAELEVYEFEYKEALKKLERNKGIQTGLSTTELEIKKLKDKLTKYKFSMVSLTELIKIKEDTIKLEEAQKLQLPSLLELRTQRVMKQQDLNDVNTKIPFIKRTVNLDKWLLKDPLSNSGLKAFIFDSMLARVNNYLKQYKPLIGFGINIYVDMSKARKDIPISIFRDDNEVPYRDLSGGEKQLTDVCICFALSDTVQSIKPINIMLMDELFESLDKDNIEIVSNIVKKKSENRCIHLITHQSSFNPLNAYKTQLTRNDKGHTQIAGKYRDN